MTLSVGSPQVLLPTRAHAPGATDVTAGEFDRELSRSNDDSVITRRGVSSTGQDAIGGPPAALRYAIGTAKNPAKPSVATSPACSR